MVRDWNDRPSLEQAMQHSYFEGFDFE